MALNKDGVKYYTKAQGAITVNFPEDRTTCEFCPYRYFDSIKVARCRITEEFLPYPTVGVGTQCPLKIIEKEE
ncbi:hypothetical protein [Dialister invisus]|uniref:hypothetical protein n=1 Tax=Dialister invisus TaxID=218538 RepID=UPI0023F98646|nr:hypothetical protein [Dialister invisus]